MNNSKAEGICDYTDPITNSQFDSPESDNILQKMDKIIQRRKTLTKDSGKGCDITKRCNCQNLY
jgi:hypothetical protein